MQAFFFRDGVHALMHLAVGRFVKAVLLLEEFLRWGNHTDWPIRL